MKILFCNIAWMKNYQGVTKVDVPKNGGKFIDENKYGGEVFNFVDYNGKCHGYVMVNGNLNLEKHYKEISSQESQSEGFTIIWCAMNVCGGTKIVGWYENATIYREQQFIPSFTDENSSLYFNFVADSKDCHLLPENQRTFGIERASVAGKGHGFGQSNVWYAESAYAQKELIPEVLKYIKEYDGEFINFAVTNELIYGMIDDEKIKDNYDELLAKGLENCNEDIPEYDKALQYFNTARNVKETPEVLNYIGYVLFKYHCFDEAIPLFEKCVDLGYEKETITAFLIHAYDYSGNREKTLEYCKNLITMLGNSQNKDDIDSLIKYSTTMCKIYIYLSEFKSATDSANQILKYADNEEAKKQVSMLLDNIREAQEMEESM